MNNIYPDFKIKRPLLYGVFIILIGIVSCQNLEEFTLNTIPSPQNAGITKVDRNAILAWDAVSDPRVTSYEIQLGSDSEFSVVLKTDTIPSSLLEYTFENLESEESYAARVRALNPDPLTNSFYTSVLFISNEIENIFRLLTDDHIGVGSVLLRWNEPSEGSVTRITFTPVSPGEQITVVLTPEQVASREASVEVLNQNRTEYLAEIFDGEVNRGEIRFITIDINAVISVDGGIYGDLQAAINAATSGSVVRVGASVYDFSALQNGTILINNKSLTIQAASDEGAKPDIKLRNFNIIGDVGYLKLIGLKIQSISRAETSLNTDYNKHLFGVTYVTDAFHLEITDCELTGAESGLIFTQGVGAASAPDPIPGTGIFSMAVENSLLYDFGNAGGDFIDFRSGSVAGITLKNSSIWNSARALLRADPDVAFIGTSGFILENMTINNFCNGGRFVDVRANGKTVVRNSIITNKPSNQANRMQNGATLEIINSNLFGTNINNVTAGATVTERLNVDPQYQNASAGNFKVNNHEIMKARLGDTRWLD
ncbi:DUF5123 domain-containing protein [Anditalea andensis]|uniref:Fibronectin type-III domain-containing protein n=1 Tax=Anditalea andensis TaxID=1048983 RepID=A0A074KZB7_9BACT|nr:DUF5123 domain-containing protein [Anditalea andensis]KEO74259.1 hypothetical protein EL17_08995 [Anditalea andensis]